jgi:hypothetical protein
MQPALQDLSNSSSLPSEADICFLDKGITYLLLQLECSLPCRQQPALDSFMGQMNAVHLTHFLTYPLNIIPSSYISQVAFSLQISQSIFRMPFLSPRPLNLIKNPFPLSPAKYRITGEAPNLVLRVVMAIACHVGR